MNVFVVYPNARAGWELLREGDASPLHFESEVAERTRELAVARDLAMEANQAKSRFVANMSHELRTPLNAIIGYSEMLQEEAEDLDQRSFIPDLQKIHGAGKHLLGLINDILDQAKINSGKMDLQKDYFDVKPVVEGVRSIGIGLVKEKPVDIRLDIASGLPKCFGDEFRTRQVLINLVSNAAKFTQQGSITIREEQIGFRSRTTFLQPMR